MNQPPIDRKTPNWFREIFYSYIKPIHDRSRRNERWSWVILGVIVAGQLTNHWHIEIWEFIKHLFGII